MTMRLGLALVAATASLLAQVKLPPYTHDVLPNGVVLDMMPKAGVPLVRFRVLVKGGTEAEPGELAGLSSVTAQLLRKGTAKRSASQFSDELDFLGGTFQTGGFGEQYSSATTINAEFLTKDLDEGLDLLSDAILNPTFSQAEVDKLIALRVDAVKSLKDNPQAAIPSYYEAFFFGPKHPFGHPADERSLARIRRGDIVEFHKHLYCGRNLVVIVAGDFDAASAKAKIGGVFSQVDPGKAVEWSAPSSSTPKTRLLLVDKPDATQTYFYIGQPGIDRHNPDRVKLLILNTLFGGRFTSMLNDELRVNSGLTYGAFSAVQEYRVPGSIYISTYTKTETTGKAMDVALEILKRLSDKGISAEQLASAKAYIKGTFPPERLETADELAATLADLELYGLGRDEVDSFFARIDAVTLDDANQTARKYFRSDRLTFVTVGNAAKIRDAVKKYSDDLTEISIKEPGFRGGN